MWNSKGVLYEFYLVLCQTDSVVLYNSLTVTDNTVIDRFDSSESCSGLPSKAVVVFYYTVDSYKWIINFIHIFLL